MKEGALLMAKNYVGEDMSRSAKAFHKIVYPKIRSWLGEGELVSVEAVTESDIADKLDQYAGIDNWYIVTEKGVRGLGSRVQWTTPNRKYDSFTVRKERQSGTRTEYEKRKEAIEKGFIYPYWTCQAFIHKEREDLMSVALCKTLDLINYIKNGELGRDYFINKVQKHGKAKFFVVYWDTFQEKCEINIWDANSSLKGENGDLNE